MLLSKLWYVGAVAPLTLKFVDSAMSDIAKFVWRSKEWLNRLTAIGQPIKGGLGLYSIRDRLEAYYVRHLADFLWGPPAKWQGLASYFIALVMRRWNPDVWNNHTPHSDSPTLPPFYATALAGFKRYVNTVATVDDPSTTVKIVYAKFVEQKFLPPRVESLSPAIDFGATWRALTHSDMSPEARDTVWRAVHNILPVRTFLSKMGYTCLTTCPMCESQPESVAHIFTQCATARFIWTYIESNFALKLPRERINILHLNFASDDAQLAQTTAVVCGEVMHAMWVCRNHAHFDGEAHSNKRVIRAGLARVRLRVRADFSRLPADEFDVRWGRHDAFARVGPDGLDVRF
jgi:hypothetical protein